MTMQAKIGDSLLKSLIQRREQKGALSIEDVGAIFAEMAGTLQPHESATDRFLREEIERMAHYIHSAKHEIFTINPDGEKEKALADASQHLDAVIKATEEASNTIMDAADAIQNAASGIGGEKEQQIMDAAMKIYEACNFQDLTGQRITKVMTLLDTIEEKIDRLVTLFRTNDGMEPMQPVKSDSNVIQGEFNEKDLLNGPQLPGSAPTQAEIDALFASVKP